jgi:hypothetical protein
MSSPYYYGTPKTAIGQAVTANSGRDGSGTLADVFSGGANGSVLVGVAVQAIGTVSDGMVRLFHYDGSNNRLLAEIEVTATTPSASAAAFEAVWAPTFPVVIPSGGKLKASTETGDDFNVVASYGDL